MIPTGRVEILEASVALLNQFQAAYGARGRFVALYLGLRRMGERVAPLGSQSYTPISEIEAYLDRMWTKTHKAGPVNVLTAPFGGSTGVNAGYSTSTGVVAPGNRYATNTWRNNLNVQKGVGCVAEPEVIEQLLQRAEVRMACPHMRYSEEAGHVCGVNGTSYRGEEHSIWVANNPNGYQIADLTQVAAYDDYLKPGGTPIPVFPLIGALYSLSADGFYPERSSVGIPEFASDFGFPLEEVDSIFDCDPAKPLNQAILTLSQIQEEPAGSTPQPIAPTMPTLGEAILLNSGLGAELAVADQLVEQDWEVRYTGNQQRLGYDLEARKDGNVMQVEVKSSVGFTTPELTESEWAAAQQLGDSYVLAVVDFYGSEQQTIWFVRDPAEGSSPSVRVSTSYRLPRTSLEPLRTEVDFL